MSDDVRKRLAGLGLRLPEVSPPKGAYVPAVRSGRYVFVAGQIPLTDGELTQTGRVGAEVSPERARSSAGNARWRPWRPWTRWPRWNR